MAHSVISPAVIREGERFYGGRMVWLLDAVEPYEGGRLDLRRRESKVATAKACLPRPHAER
jgi:hypothetical protein